GVAASASGLPEYREPPVASLAYKLPSGDSRNWLSRALRDLSFRPADEILPLFENTIVFSVRDAEPVIQTHFPALSRFGQSGKLSGMSGEEMLLVPIVGALLTRPCDLAIKVKDEAAVRDKLRWFASLLPHDHWDPLDIERVFLEKEKRVVGSLSLEGLIRFDFSLSVENGWLHLSNHPWSHVPITGTSPATAPNHVQLTLDASQLKAGLPQALALAGTAWRKSVYASASELLPWMVAYDVGAVEALKLQQAALGRSTPPPRGVEFSASPLLETKPYGTWYRTSVPSADLADTGLFRDLRGLRLWMRFEDDGLRSRTEFLPQK
ncbi:MAG: hypothetical protein LBV28_06110, partial [Puniceicoccales bacterium]|nr:hypothetical protein [Puniceicoccales bacterium]